MMIPRQILLPATLALSLLPLHSGTAAAAEVVTVVLKNGVRHEQVSYRVVREFNTLELKSGERLVQVSFSDVEAVLDVRGDNIAPRLLGSRYRPTGAVSPGDRVPQRSGSIVLKSGERLDYVRYMLNPARRELTIHRGAQPRAVPYDSVGTLLDSEGKDVTTDLVEPPAWADSTSDAPRSPEPSPSMRPPRPWRAALVLDGGLDAPLGDYYDGAKGGPGFGGTVLLAVTHDLALRATVSRLGLGFDGGFGLVSLDPGIEILSQNYSMDAVRIQAGLAYWQTIERRNAWAGFWSVHSSIGAIRHGLQGSATFRNTGTGETFLGTASNPETKLAMTSGAAAIFMVGRRIGLEISGDIDFVWTTVYRSDGSTGAAVKGYVLGIRGGLALVR